MTNQRRITVIAALLAAAALALLFAVGCARPAPEPIPERRIERVERAQAPGRWMRVTRRVEPGETLIVDWSKP